MDNFGLFSLSCLHDLVLWVETGVPRVNQSRYKENMQLRHRIKYETSCSEVTVITTKPLSILIDTVYVSLDLTATRYKR